ncbi:MAG TPA: LytTR family DNA-binding domain-containing protein [Thermoanaerobaculia bacterium]|nr:LytTR family DNA-binding domain-containing protein [Thermoanaerobaculia bacterium]
MADRTLRVLIVDDEPLARQRIEDLLVKEPNMSIAGAARDGDEAVALIRDLAPDLVFLDVQMPGRTGLDVVQAIGAEMMPPTIFTTAYEQFASKAFDVAAVDYLVKPFDDERFAQALARARKVIATHAPKSEYLDRIPVESRGQIRVVPVSKIDYITASGPYAELHVGERVFAVREKMQTLEEQLDPNVFFRIHRSAIVRLDRIDALLHAAGGDYAVRLKDGTELSVSRSRREELEERVGARR